MATVTVVVGLGGALLSAFVGQLVQKLISHELDMYDRRKNIDDDIKDWATLLYELNTLLDDAEDRKSDTAVKNWLDVFRDLTYDIDDLLDEFNTEALKRQGLEHSQAITNKMRKKISTPFTSRAFKNKMASRMKEITERLQRINLYQQQTLHLRRNTNGTTSNQPKESDAGADDLIGRTEVEERIDAGIEDIVPREILQEDKQETKAKKARPHVKKLSEILKTSSI